MKKEWQKDIEIIKNCLQNLEIEDHIAHTIFYKEYYYYIRNVVLKTIRYCKIILPDLPGILDDFTQEIIIKLILKRQLEKYNPYLKEPISPKSWIKLITWRATMNLLRDHFKVLNQKVSIEDIVIIDNLTPEIFIQYLALIELIENLPSKKSSLLIERFSKKESIKEIAKKLGKRPNTVTQMIRRIVKEIIEELS